MDPVQEQVAEELALIPRGGLSQNLLRMNYQMIRSNALGANPDEPLTAARTLESCVAMVKQFDPTFVPRFDRRLVDST
jgi:hypothetical protein